MSPAMNTTLLTPCNGFGRDEASDCYPGQGGYFSGKVVQAVALMLYWHEGVDLGPRSGDPVAAEGVDPQCLPFGFRKFAQAIPGSICLV